MDLSDARTEVQNRGFEQLTDSRIDAFLNLAKNQFEDAAAFPWLQATTTGTAPLTITDLKDILYVADSTNGQELEGADPRLVIVEDVQANIATAGTPMLWWLDGLTTLNIWPANTNVSLSVRYVKESPELTEDTDTPLIPARYHQTWVDLAAVRCYLDLKDLDSAATLRAIVAQDLAGIVARYQARNHQNPVFQEIRGYSEDW